MKELTFEEFKSNVPAKGILMLVHLNRVTGMRTEGCVVGFFYRLELEFKSASPEHLVLCRTKFNDGELGDLQYVKANSIIKIEIL